MRPTTKDTNGTSWYGCSINTTANNIKKVLGQPAFENNSGNDKTNFDWQGETDDGSVFTVYDWKEYRPIDLDEIISYHIGGFDEKSTIEAKKELEYAIKNFA